MPPIIGTNVIRDRVMDILHKYDMAPDDYRAKIDMADFLDAKALAVDLIAVMLETGSRDVSFMHSPAGSGGNLKSDSKSTSSGSTNNERITRRTVAVVNSNHDLRAPTLSPERRTKRAPLERNESKLSQVSSIRSEVRQVPHEDHVFANTQSNQEWPIDRNDCVGPFKLTRKIGKGQSIVYLGTKVEEGENWPEAWRNFPNQVAIKALQIKKQNKKDFYTANNEIFMNKVMAHKHILKLHGILYVRPLDADPEVDSLEWIFLVLPFYPGGAVGEARQNPSNGRYCLDMKLRTTEFLLRIALHTTRALRYLHSRKMYHRDIKPGNLLYDNTKELVVLADFGTSHAFEHGGGEKDRFRNGGTPPFVPPEIVELIVHNFYERLEVNEKLPDWTAPVIAKPRRTVSGEEWGLVDVWAFGVTLYFIHFNKLPFHDQALTTSNLMPLYRCILFDSPVVPEDTDEDLTDLLMGMLRKDPTKRLTIEDVRRHPYIQRAKRTLEPRTDLQQEDSSRVCDEERVNSPMSDVAAAGLLGDGFLSASTKERSMTETRIVPPTAFHQSPQHRHLAPRRLDDSENKAHFPEKLRNRVQPSSPQSAQRRRQTPPHRAPSPQTAPRPPPRIPSQIDTAGRTSASPATLTSTASPNVSSATSKHPSPMAQSRSPSARNVSPHVTPVKTLAPRTPSKTPSPMAKAPGDVPRHHTRHAYVDQPLPAPIGSGSGPRSHDPSSDRSLGWAPPPMPPLSARASASASPMPPGRNSLDSLASASPIPNATPVKQNSCDSLGARRVDSDTSLTSRSPSFGPPAPPPPPPPPPPPSGPPAGPISPPPPSTDGQQQSFQRSVLGYRPGTKMEVGNVEVDIPTADSPIAASNHSCNSSNPTVSDSTLSSRSLVS